MAIGIGSLLVGATAALFFPVGLFLAMTWVATTIGAASAWVGGASLSRIVANCVLCLVLTQVGYVVSLFAGAFFKSSKGDLIKPLLRLYAAGSRRK